VREFWAVVGRRGGKDSIASLIATVMAIDDYRDRLRPGEHAVVMCVAADRSQARIIFRYIQGYFQSIALLQPLVARETDYEIELTNGVLIIVATNSYKAVRGRTIVCAIFDEVAFWRDENSVNPDFEVYNSVMPGLATLPDAMLIGISSPYRRGGLLFEKWARHYGRPDDDVLVVRGPSRLFNPTLPQAIVDAALENDPEAAGAEYNAEWRSDIADYVSREVVRAATPAGVFELPPAAGINYAAFVDPSGGSSDSMTLAITHRDRDGTVVLDAIREMRAPFSPEAAVADFAGILRAYCISRITGDRYAGEWPRERFAVHGIQYEPSELTKSDIYRELLPLLNGGRARLLDHPRLISQLCSLERRTMRGGRDSIDHRPGGYDDIANAVAGALVTVAADARASLIARPDLYVDGDPVPLPAICDAMFAVTAVHPRTGMSATVFLAKSSVTGHPLVLIDFEVSPLSGEMLRATFTRLGELAAQCRVRHGVRGVFLPEVFTKFTNVSGLRVRAIPREWEGDPARLAMPAAAHIVAGHVKIAVPAGERARTSPLAAAFDFRGGDTTDDPLRQALLIAIALAFE
jgi:hypothetical protein